jgi:RNA methyltransferase, TrmH family
MSDTDNPYRGPKRPGPRPPPRERPESRAPRDRPAAPPHARHDTAPPRDRRDPPPYARREAPARERPAQRGEHERPPPRPGVEPTTGAATGVAPRAPRDPDEVRLYGMNACRAAFAARPDDLRKVYLSEARIGTLRDVLAWCVRQRLGYRVVETDDLDRLAASSHHEGVVFEMRRRTQPTLTRLLEQLAAGAQTLVWLDGVGNPHNFGALLRSAAHFGAAGVLLPPGSPLTLSGAACRVAEGGAEAVPVVRLDAVDAALTELKAAGFVPAATLPQGGQSIYGGDLPERLVLVFGAEGGGMQRALIDACPLQLSIPGTGRVESLNIANAAAVMLAEAWRRAHR